MQTKNFKLNEGFSSLTYQDKHFDLHNNFNLVENKHDEVQKVVELTFTKSTGDWVPKDSPNGLILLFKNVADVYYKDDDKDYPAEYIAQDEFTVNMVGFSYGDNEIMDGVTDIVSRPDLPALLFVMETGKAIKVIADSVELIIK